MILLKLVLSVFSVSLPRKKKKLWRRQNCSISICRRRKRDFQKNHVGWLMIEQNLSLVKLSLFSGFCSLANARLKKGMFKILINQKFISFTSFNFLLFGWECKKANLINHSPLFCSTLNWNERFRAKFKTVLKKTSLQNLGHIHNVHLKVHWYEVCT